jgi:hypothetical protein
MESALSHAAVGIPTAAAILAQGRFRVDSLHSRCTDAEIIMVVREGIYRRRIRSSTAPGFARADIEDDPHRYGVIVHHDGERITAIEGVPLRTPWDLCVDAAQQLQLLIGMPLAPSPTAVHRYTRAAQQCTHMFDVAGVAVAHAARGIAARQYDVEVPVTAVDGISELYLRRDGELILHWRVERDVIVAPAEFAGRDVRTLQKWAETALNDPDQYEAVVLLRRAMKIAACRYYDLDTAPVASAIGDVDQVMGGCFVYQPGVAERAARKIGSMRDFTRHPELMLRDLDA